MSITADGAHFDTCTGVITVVDGLFEGMGNTISNMYNGIISGQGDDGLNVHGDYSDINSLSIPMIIFDFIE